MLCFHSRTFHRVGMHSSPELWPLSLHGCDCVRVLLWLLWVKIGLHHVALAGLPQMSVPEEDWRS